MATLSQRPRSRHIQARLVRAINVPMRRLLGLPFPTPPGSRLMRVDLTGRRTGRRSATSATKAPCSPRRKQLEAQPGRRPAGPLAGIYRHRPRGALRHYAGLLGPTGAVAGRVVIERDLPLRVARLTDAVRSRRARIEPMRALVAGPGGRLRWRSARAPGPPGPLGANVRPLAMATCDLDRPLMLGATPLPLPLQLGHECVAEVIAIGGDVRTVVPGQRVVVP